MSSNYSNKVNTGWDLATRLRDEKDYNNSTSRMYYAVFQAVLFYAVSKEKFDRKKALTDKKNVHGLMRGLVAKKMTKTQGAAEAYDDLRVLRNQADYDPDDVRKSDLAPAFIQSVENIKNFFLKEAKI